MMEKTGDIKALSDDVDAIYTRRCYVKIQHNDRYQQNTGARFTKNLMNFISFS